MVLGIAAGWPGVADVAGACGEGPSPLAVRQEPTRDSVAGDVPKPNRFWISLAIAQHHAGRNGTLSFDETGALRYCVRGKEGTLELPQGAVRSIEAAAAEFVKRPAAFLTAFGSLSGGTFMFVEVMASGQTRASIVYSWSVPREVRELASQLRQALARAEPREVSRGPLELLLGEFAKAPRAELDAALKADLLHIPNASPQDLVPAVVRLGTEGQEPRGGFWTVQCLSFLGSLRYVRLGAEVLGQYRRLPAEKTDLRLQVLWESIVGGCTEGMPDFAPLLRREAEPPEDYQSELGRCIGEVFKQEVQKQVLGEIGEKGLTRSNAERVWLWLLRNRHQLEFDPEQHKYGMKRRL